LKTLRPVITLTEYGLMPITQIRQRIYNLPGNLPGAAAPALEELARP